VPSALVFGTFAPDLEYFIRLAPGGGWGHTITGAFGLSLPLGLLALWLFHRAVKLPLACLLPDRVRSRLTPQLAPFRFGPPLRFLLIVVSLLLGIATHLFWDGFTHEHYWGAHYFAFLLRDVRLPVLGYYPWFAILQNISSVAGLAILALWSLAWLRHAAPDPSVPVNPFSPARRVIIVLGAVTVAVVGAVARAYLDLGIPENRDEIDEFLNRFVVTTGALLWWQLTAWGLFGSFRHPRPARPRDRAPARRPA